MQPKKREGERVVKGALSLAVYSYWKFMESDCTLSKRIQETGQVYSDSFPATDFQLWQLVV